MKNTNNANRGFEEKTVEYVNTTAYDFHTSKSERIKESTGDTYKGLSTVKRFEYNCELGYNDMDESTGVIYYFPHYCIHSPNHKIQIDSEEFVDVTYLMAYNDFITVLMKRTDLSNDGFKAFLKDTLLESIIFLNNLKLKASDNEENYAGYRQTRTLVDFINKYSKELKWTDDKETNLVLIHTVDENPRHYSVVNIFEDLSEYNYDTHEFTATQPQSLEDIITKTYHMSSSDVDFESVKALGDEIEKQFGAKSFNMKMTKLENIDISDVTDNNYCVIGIQFGGIDSEEETERYKEFIQKVHPEYIKLWTILKTKFESDESVDSLEVGSHFRIEVKIPGKNPDVILKNMKKNGCHGIRRLFGKLSCYVFDLVKMEDCIQLYIPVIRKA